ncbi:MAG: ABC transporter ATP-binding protein [Sporomusaceae bacterium]|jgi:tungstate transport system ATP-binding protein|nr:ABC transporter ATP-binding protein [Sporomusaceae bacterium]
MNTWAVSIKNMKSCRDGRVVLDIDEILIHKSEHVAVVGINGAGKSTLLQVINALLPYQSGEVKIFGQTQNTKNAFKLRQISSLVFQEPILLEDTVYENIALPLKFRKTPAKEIAPLVKKAMASFHCEHLASRHALSLSGGEAQRVCLARALVYEPELLLLDEPFTALDAVTRTEILADLKKAATDVGMTVILVSHNYKDVLYFATRAIALESGKIIQDGAPEKLLRYPATKSVASLVGMDNIFPCLVKSEENNVLIRISDEICFAKKECDPIANTCCLTGDELTLLQDNTACDLEKLVIFDAVITHITPGISIYKIMLTGGGLSFVARIPREKSLNLKIGMNVRAAFNAQGTHLI